MVFVYLGWATRRGVEGVGEKKNVFVDRGTIKDWTLSFNALWIPPKPSRHYFKASDSPFQGSLAPNLTEVSLLYSEGINSTL